MNDAYQNRIASAVPGCDMVRSGRVPSIEERVGES